MARIKLPKTLTECDTCKAVPSTIPTNRLSFVAVWELQHHCQECARRGQAALSLVERMTKAQPAEMAALLEEARKLWPKAKRRSR
jgi:hypothetical protein